MAVPVRTIDRNSIRLDEDWEGNNAAFICPLCKKGFIVSACFMGGAGHAPIRNAASHSVGSKAANHPAAAQGSDGATNRFGDHPHRRKRFSRQVTAI
jgi:hypothetical protein